MTEQTALASRMRGYLAELDLVDYLDKIGLGLPSLASPRVQLCADGKKAVEI